MALSRMQLSLPANAFAICSGINRFKFVHLAQGDNPQVWGWDGNKNKEKFAEISPSLSTYIENEIIR